MIKNYIKIALRNIKRQKVYSLITMSGLIVGLSVFIMFALLTDLASNYDSFNEKADRIYAVVQVLPGAQGGEQHSAIMQAPLVPAMISEFPEIEKACRFYPPGQMIVKHQDKIFYENGIRFVDPDFLSIFTFKMLEGEKESALTRPNSVVMTEDSALKYFGDKDPLGKTLTLDNKMDVVVTGVTERVPNDSSIVYDFLVSMDTARTLYSWMDDWSANNQAAFLLLSEGADPVKLEEKFSSFIDRHYADTPETPKRFYLHSLLNFFLGSEGIESYWGGGRISYVTIWAVAVLLLIIACINFMNVSTARYLTRAREVGMRKVVGARRSQLIKQFLGESTIMAFISMPLAILLYELMRPVLAANLGEIFDASVMDHPHVLVLVVGVTLLTGIFAGSYPAFYLSASPPVLISQGRLVSGKKGSRLRKLLVVVQFTFSIILILMTVISIKQSRHNLAVDLGFDRTDVVAVTMPQEFRGKLDILKNELLRSKDILSVTASAALPVEWRAEKQVLPEGFIEGDAFDMNAYAVDYGFVEMMGIDIVQGRSFSREYNDAGSFIINETAAKQLKWDNPIGKRLAMGDRKGTIIGVSKDYHFKSIVLEKISPAVLYLAPDEMNYVFVKYSGRENLSGVVESIGEKWRLVAPDLPFEYTTLENAFYDVFQGDKTSEMTGTLGVLAIFLSCLGLFGLSSYSVERRQKEIGIRKVLGASVSRIVRMLTGDFIKLVAIADLIAIPIAYFSMNAIIRFVYSYPVKIGIGIFILTTVLTLLVAFLTVFSQTIRSAMLNPANSLKHE